MKQIFLSLIIGLATHCCVFGMDSLSVDECFIKVIGPLESKIGEDKILNDDQAKELLSQVLLYQNEVQVILSQYVENVSAFYNKKLFHTIAGFDFLLLHPDFKLSNVKNKILYYKVLFNYELYYSIHPEENRKNYKKLLKKLRKNNLEYKEFGPINKIYFDNSSFENKEIFTQNLFDLYYLPFLAPFDRDFFGQNLLIFMQQHKEYEEYKEDFIVFLMNHLRCFLNMVDWNKILENKNDFKAIMPSIFERGSVNEKIHQKDVLNLLNCKFFRSKEYGFTMCKKYLRDPDFAKELLLKFNNFKDYPFGLVKELLVHGLNFTKTPIHDLQHLETKLALHPILIGFSSRGFNDKCDRETGLNTDNYKWYYLPIPLKLALLSFYGCTKIHLRWEKNLVRLIMNQVVQNWF